MSEKFRQRMESLRKELERCASGVSRHCTSVLLVIAVLIPFITLGVIYWMKPMIAVDKEAMVRLGGERKLSLSRTAGLTLGISVVGWIVLYLLSMWEPFQSLLCVIA
jgi:hypothetical protein